MTESLLVAQIGHDWSGERIDDDPRDVLRQSVGHVAEPLDDDRFAGPDWTDTQGWRYALPNDGITGDGHRECEDARVHAALRSGLDVGERIAETV